MTKTLKVLIVEDEMIIGAKISLYLEQMGHEVLGLLPRGEDAMPFFSSNTPDLILLDIQLKGDKSGIDIAREIKAKFDTPIIFITANSDDHHFDQAREVGPEAFIAKPFNKRDLQRAIDLMLSRQNESKSSDSTPLYSDPEPTLDLMDDRIFIFDKGKRDRVFIKDIYYLEADRNYTKIHTLNKEYLISLNLRGIEEKLPNDLFLRVHRSYIINLHAVESIHENHVILQGQSIPMTKGMKAILMEKVRIL